MKIIAFESTDISEVVEYFDFNRIQYNLTNLWQQDLDSFGRHIIGSDLAENSNQLLVIDYKVFLTMCRWPTSLEQIIKFCNNNNNIWVWNSIDSLVNSLHFTKQSLLDIDCKIPKGSIKIFLDGEWSDRHPLTKLSNIHHRVLPYSFFLTSARIENATCDKVSCSRDFMLTTIKKGGRPHREILINQIKSFRGLYERGYINYTTVNGPRIGLQSYHYTSSDGHPSMDLYRDSWLEIVPETLYRDGFFITEKTVKPIMTKTPFLIVSTCRYLEYLRRQGFKTFGNIIDENYDRQYLIEDRVRLMLVQLQDIIQNGTESFYTECKSVLEHNQNRLFEIAGRKQYDMDMFISSNLDELLIF